MITLNDEKDNITDEEIDKYEKEVCAGCPFYRTSFCEPTKDSIRDCIIIDKPVTEIPL